MPFIFSGNKRLGYILGVGGGSEKFERVTEELEKRTHKMKVVGWTGSTGEA